MIKSKGKNRDSHSGFSVSVLKLATFALQRYEKGENLDTVLDNIRDDKAGKTVADILFNYFRNKGKIDYLIDSHTIKTGRKKSVPSKFRRIISIALVQSQFQSGISSYAACDIAVGFARKRYGGKIANFINAVLRGILALNYTESLKDAPEHVLLNIPLSVLTRWRKVFTEKEITDIAEVIAVKPAMTFRVSGNITEKELEKFNCNKLKTPEWVPEGYSFYETDSPEFIFECDFINSGSLYIQDLSTISPALLYVPKENDVIYDLCAAPGGKSMLIGEKKDCTSTLIASDISFNRQKITCENIRKKSVENIFATVASALNPPFRKESADCVLIDVPCTNTGVTRRRPDVLWNFSEKKIRKLTSLQTEILNSAAELVKPGGTLIYSTCSIEKEENRERIELFLTEHPDFSLLTERQLLPTQINDGGYTASLKKTYVGIHSDTP